MKAWHLLLAVNLLASCSSPQPAQRASVETEAGPQAPHETPPETRPDTALAMHARLIAKAFAQNDCDFLQPYVAPGERLLFSPSAFVDTAQAVRLPIAALRSGTRSLRWGYAEGSGTPLELTVRDYLKRFVCDKNYAAADSVLIDKPAVRSSTVRNLKAVFPGSRPVELFMASKNPAYQGTDWSSLILVFNPPDTTLRLLAVVHDQWSP